MTIKDEILKQCEHPENFKGQTIADAIMFKKTEGTDEAMNGSTDKTIAQAVAYEVPADEGNT